MIKQLVLCVACLAACRSSGERTKRTGSAAPVEIVNQPQLPDGGHGPGPTADEIEPNDGDEVATPLGLGGTGRGRIDPEADVDYYRVEVDRPGELQVLLTGVEGVDLMLELFDASGTLIAKSDRGAARIKEGVPNAGVTPGKYTLVIKQAPKKKAKGKQSKGKAAPEPVATAPAPVYEVTAVLAATSPGREREPDDDRGTANDLIVADNAIGYLGWTNDRDVWKLSVETLSEKNAVDVQVSAIEGVALELEVADGLGQVLATRKAPKGQPVVLRGLLPIVPAGAPPFHYLTLKGSASNPETTYTLHATAHVVGPDDEVEPNDSPDKPFAMPAERTVVHAVWTPGDVDCIGIAASDALRTIDVAIDTPAEIDLAVELLVDGKPVATANKGGKGVIEKLSALVPIGVRPVIRVKNPDANATIGIRSGLLEAKYDISVQETNATGDNAP